MFKALRRLADAASTSARSIRRCRPRSSTARRTRCAIIQVAKLYEVQKYLLADQPHVGRLLVPRQRQGLEARCRRTCRRSSRSTSTRPRVKQREDIAKLNADAREGAAEKGLAFNTRRHRRLPREAAARPGSTRSGRASSATKPGRCWRSTPASSVKPASVGQRDATPTRRGTPRRRLRRRSAAGCHDRGRAAAAAASGCARVEPPSVGGRDPAALLVAVEIGDPVRRRGRALRLPPAARSGRTSSPRSCSCGSRCSARWSRCGAASTCA